MEVTIREATVHDLPGILELYAQPDMDNGEVLSVEQAEAIFRRMSVKYMLRCMRD